MGGGGGVCPLCKADVCLLGMNPGGFGPIPVRSGRFGLGRFGPISGVSRFGPVGAVVSALFHRWVVSARFLG